MIKNILLSLSTGYIFVYFSEHLFWAHIRTDDSFISWAGAWIAYSLLSFVFLALVSYFRVKDIWSLFLIGSIFGWLAEGVIVQTTYEMLPLSISFTGLAWHALITVWIGWYAMHKTLLSSSVWPVLRLSSLIGFVYGFWAVSWWVEPDGKMSSIPEFAIFNFTITILVILAYRLANWSLSSPPKWHRGTVIFVAALFVLYFFVITVPASPSALIILPLLLGMAYWGLRQNRISESEGSLLESFSSQIPAQNYLGLLGLPAAGVLVYTFAMAINLNAHTNWVLYLITTPLGFILFLVSLYKLQKTFRSQKEKIEESCNNSQHIR